MHSSGTSGILKGHRIWADPTLPTTLWAKLRRAALKAGADDTPMPLDTPPSGKVHVNSTTGFPTTIGISLNTQLSLASLPLGATIVTPKWIELSIEKGKCFDPKGFSADPEMLFSGCVISALKSIKLYDREVMYAGIDALGGQWTDDPTSPNVTHIVALDENDPDFKEAMDQKGATPDLVVITPHWVEDTFRTGRRLPEPYYTFPNPIVLADPTTVNASALTPVPVALAPFIQTPDQKKGTDGAPENALGERHPLHQKHIVIEPSLLDTMSEGSRMKLMRRLVFHRIRLVPAEEVEAAVKVASVVICLYRSGPYYEAALEAGKTIGTIVWLRSMLEATDFISPYSQLLLYPFPPQPIRGMSKARITLSNYHGPAKDYLIFLIQSIGATYTATFTSGNTHLVCGNPDGPKYVAATSWGQVRGVCVVNHLWLEETARQWAPQAVTRPRYQWYPRNPTILQDMVGLTACSRQALLAPPGEEGEGPEEVVGMEVEVEDLTERTPSPSPSPSPAPTEGSISSLLTSTSAPVRRRAAAQQAFKALAGLMQLTNDYEEEKRKEAMMSMKRKGQTKRSEQEMAEEGDASGGGLVKRIKSAPGSAHTTPKSMAGLMTPSTPKAGPIAPRTADAAISPLSSVVSPRGKEGKHSSLSPHRPPAHAGLANPVRALFTGIKATEEEIRGIRALGGRIATSPRDCTHLITNAAARTEKFLVAVSVAEFIVTRAWLQESMKAGSFVPEAAYTMRDEQAERTYDFNLAKSLAVAHTRKLLASWVIYITPRAQPSPKTLQPIVESAGGKLITSLSSRKIDELQGRLLIISSPADTERWDSAVLQRTPPPIMYSTELLLTGILRQELNLDGDEFRMD